MVRLCPTGSIRISPSSTRSCCRVPRAAAPCGAYPKSSTRGTTREPCRSRSGTTRSRTARSSGGTSRRTSSAKDWIRRGGGSTRFWPSPWAPLTRRRTETWSSTDSCWTPTGARCRSVSGTWSTRPMPSSGSVPTPSGCIFSHPARSGTRSGSIWTPSRRRRADRSIDSGTPMGSSRSTRRIFGWRTHPRSTNAPWSTGGCSTGYTGWLPRCGGRGTATTSPPVSARCSISVTTTCRTGTCA